MKISVKPTLGEQKKDKKPYTPPRVLSSEQLEAAAANCDGTGGVGKPNNVPICNPQLGSGS